MPKLRLLLRNRQTLEQKKVTLRERDAEQMGLSRVSTHDQTGDEIYDIFLRSLLPLHYISTFKRCCIRPMRLARNRDTELREVKDEFLVEIGLFQLSRR